MSFWRRAMPPPMRSDQPAPLGPDQRRAVPLPQPVPLATGRPVYARHLQPSVGADGFSYQAEYQQLSYDPIGGGVVVRDPFRPQGQAASRYQSGAILFGIQQVNFGRTPELGGPLWTPGQVAAMLGDYSAAARMTPAEAAGYGAAVGISR